MTKFLFRLRREMLLDGSPWIMTVGEKTTKITEDEAEKVFRMFREFTIPPDTSPTTKLNIDIGPARFEGIDRSQFARLQDYIAMLEESHNAAKRKANDERKKVAGDTFGDFMES